MTDMIVNQSSVEYNTFLKPYENESSTWVSKRRGIGASYLRKCGIKFNDALNAKLDSIGSLYPDCTEASFNAFMSDIKREGQSHVENQPEQRRQPSGRYNPKKARIKSFTAGNERYGDAPCIRLFGEGTLVLCVAINNKHAYPALEAWGFKNDGSGSDGFTFNGNKIERGQRIACNWQIVYGFIPGVDTSVLKIEKVEAMADQVVVAQQSLIQDEPAKTEPITSPFGAGLGKTPEQIKAEADAAIEKVKPILEKVEAEQNAESTPEQDATLTALQNAEITFEDGPKTTADQPSLNWWEDANIKTRYQLGQQANCKACKQNHGYTDPLTGWKPTTSLKVWECPRCHRRKHDSLMRIADQPAATPPIDLVEARKICKESLWPELFAEVKKLRPDITDKKVASQFILDYLEVKELAEALIARGRENIVKDVRAFLVASAPFGEDTTGAPAIKPEQPQTNVEPVSSGDTQPKAKQTPSNPELKTIESRSLVAVQPRPTLPMHNLAINWQMTPSDVARYAVESGFYKGIDSPAKAMVVMMRGLSLGIDPMMALEQINIIEGKTSVSSALMHALVERSGELDDLIVDDKKPDSVTVTLVRKGRTPVTATYTMADAQRAGLATKYNWQKQPKNMLYHRAYGIAARRAFSDILLFGGALYMHEELQPDAHVDENGDIIEAVPVTKAG